MSDHPIDELVTSQSRARQGLLRVVEPLSQVDCDHCPAPDAWSPGEILDHLAKSEAGTVKVCGRLLREADAAGAGTDHEVGSQLERLDFARLDDRQRTATSPAFVLPDHGLPKEDLLSRLAGSRVALLDLARRAKGTDLRGPAFPHPILGPLTFYQWLLFVAQHEARHTVQIRESLHADRG